MAKSFSAQLYLRPTSEGGRETPVRSGYRSVISPRCTGSRALVGREIDFESSELAPGDTRKLPAVDTAAKNGAVPRNRGRTAAKDGAVPQNRGSHGRKRRLPAPLAGSVEPLGR